jgi:hypothetical protein
MMCNRYFYKVLFLFFTGSFFGVFAGPPTPSGTGVPPPGPEVPIDEHIFVVVVISLFFGLYIVYNKLKTKKIQV